MTRSIPIALQSALDTSATTLTQLLRIAPANGAAFGLCLTNTDITYNDGDGSITYKSLYGFDDGAYQSSAGREVDNAEAKVLFAPSSGLGLTEAQVRAGYLDGARFRILLVDYSNLAGGHAILEWGFVGQIRSADGLSAMVELRGAQQMGRQKSVCERGSKTCRATFGDATTGCGFDLTGVGGSSTVAAPGSEADRVFTTLATIPVPGLVTFTSGANAGLSFEVEAYDAGEVSLMFPTPYPIASSDAFDWREDCDKTFATCKVKGQHLNFRGEPYRPEAIGDALQFPGAATS